MPPIQVSNEQRDAAIENSDDAAEAFEFGILDEALAPVCPPLAQYAGFTPTIKQTVKDGIKQFFAIQARNFSPISGSVHVTAPSFNTDTDIAVATMSVVSYIPRNVLITLNLSAYTGDPSTVAGFYVKVNHVGVSPAAQYYFNVALDHRSMGASWVAPLPGTGPTTIEAWIGVAAGPGNIILDSGDHIALTVMG